MKKNKFKKIIIIGIVVLIIIISLVLFILNFSKDDTSFSLLEKNWINNNSSNIIDVSVFNNVPLFGQNGEGIIFDFLQKFTDEYDVKFNKISYNYNTNSNNNDVSFKVLTNVEDITDNDILLYDDHYVLVSKKNNFKKTDINKAKIAVLDGDMDIVKSSLNKYYDLDFRSYSDVSAVFQSLANDEVDFVAVAMMLNFDSIVANNYVVNYHINDIENKYVLRINNNKVFKNIMTKFYNYYNETYYDESYKEYYLKNMFKMNNITSFEQSNYNMRTYTYGFVENMPYENQNNNKMIGTLSNYIDEFSSLTNTTITLKQYKNIKQLKNAYNNSEIDFMFVYYDIDDLKQEPLTITSSVDEKIVYLSNNSLVVSSARNLKNKEVLTENNTYIYDYLQKMGVKVKGYNDTEDLLKNCQKEKIVAIDYHTYNYYKLNKFKDYKVLAIEDMDYNYAFAVRKNNELITFATLLQNYLSFVNYKEIEYDYNTEQVTNENNLFTIIKVFLAFIIVVFIVVITIAKTDKKRKKDFSLSKQEKMKYIDAMTSLKNRNYLSYNMKKWDDNEIYPQAILIIDLNNIKYINDSHGHDEGDNVIKKAANILIINQQENTDIVRTDGNEFLIYMVGYKEEYIIEYIRRLNKELKELPYGYGATIGYSMILDEIKTIDDAVNEATIAMRSAKEKR